MKKDTKFQIRINTNLLNAFDDVAGKGNRSRKIVELMEGTVELSNKYYKETFEDGTIYFYPKS